MNAAIAVAHVDKSVCNVIVVVSRVDSLVFFRNFVECVDEEKVGRVAAEGVVVECKRNADCYVRA